MKNGSFTKTASNLKRIREQQKRQRKSTFAITYTAPHAAKIHEDMEMPHTNGQAKFLEIPLRLHGKKITRMVKELMKQGKTLRKALLEVAYWLLEESKKLVPVDTGELRDSGKVRIVNA